MARARASQENDNNDEKQVTRREFLNIAWLASMGFLFIDFLGVTYFFAFPRFKEGEFGGTFTVGGADSLPDVGQEPVANAKGKFWLTRTEQGVRALYKVCTHLGCLYNWQGQENKFICPCHGSQFTYEGEYIQGPAPRSLDVFVMRALNPDTGEVLAQTDAPGEPLPVQDDSDVVYVVDTGDKLNGIPH